MLAELVGQEEAQVGHGRIHQDGQQGEEDFSSSRHLRVSHQIYAEATRLRPAGRRALRNSAQPPRVTMPRVIK